MCMHEGMECSVNCRCDCMNCIMGDDDETEPECEHPNTACPRGCGCGCPPCAFADYGDVDGYNRNGATDGFHVYSDADNGL